LRSLQLFPQDPGVEQVLHPDAHPGDLVAVGGPDATAGRADAGRPEVALDYPVERPVVRHDQMRVSADQEPRDVDAALGEPVDLGEQHLRVDDHAVADHDGRVGRQGSRWHQMQRVALAVRGDHGVARVVAAGVTHDVVDAATEQVGNLAFALVAPLCTDEHDRWHVCSSP
jgi:hypothetical protein